MLTGCASYTEPRFSSWGGDDTFIGEGGEVHRFDVGQYETIEIWTRGAPDKKHQIVGMIRQISAADDYLQSLVKGRLKRDLISLIRDNNGHGLYLYRSERIVAGSDTNITMEQYKDAEKHAKYQTNYILAVYQYID